MKVSVPVKVPAKLGSKVTVTVQLFPAPSFVPQVLVWVKTDRFETMLVMLVEVLPLLVSVTVWEALVVSVC